MRHWVHNRSLMWDGLKRLRKILRPEDWRHVVRIWTSLRRQLRPTDFADQGQLLGKIYASAAPAAVGRFLEIMGEFTASAEGQALLREFEAWRHPDHRGWDTGTLALPSGSELF